MLGDAKIGAFLCVRDREAAKRFYAGTLGLTLTREDSYALVFDAGGTVLRVSPVKELQPQPFTVLGWQVPDIVAVMERLAAAGVVFVRVPGLNQDALCVWSPAPGVKVAWFKDPDGNLLSLGQHGSSEP
ncbi:MAG TPA: VOC family protein [Rhizomicrobium sp.]|nr:VOC family protein [Rhizomicrobium sp.]